MATPSPAPSAPVAPVQPRDSPTVVLVIGMAGSGKTTLMQRLNAHVHEKSIPSYIINLDPAVHKLPYSANIDIRDTVNYKQVMKQYNLGPNGGIMTSLNLFATRFDQVMGFVAKRAPELKYVFVDTPGQIEVFTWSASGSIITESLASLFPTVVLYVVDTTRANSPSTFMSNMMYACSIMYKTRLPFLLVFNKTDVLSHDFAVRWMTDSDSFMDKLRTDQSYMSSLTRSLSLSLEEFYVKLRHVGVSAVTGSGMDELFQGLEGATREFLELYRPALERKRQEIAASEDSRRQQQLQRVMEDIKQSQSQSQTPLAPHAPAAAAVLKTDADDEEAYDNPEDEQEDRAQFDEWMKGRAQRKAGSQDNPNS